MISKDGRYWATGITVRYGYKGAGQFGWGASLNFYDDGFVSDSTGDQLISTEGELRTRYMVGDDDKFSGLSVAVNVLLSDAENLGIRFMESAAIYYHQDGEDADNPPPDGWRGALGAEAARLGWMF